MGRGEGEHPTPIPKDLSRLMMCLYSTVGKSLHFRPNIKAESAPYLPETLHTGQDIDWPPEALPRGWALPNLPHRLSGTDKVER